MHIRGGNPLLEWEYLQAVLAAVRRYPGLRLLITTPGTGQLLDQILSLYHGGQVHLNIVMFSIDAQDYGNVCGRPDILEEQIGLVDVLVEQRVPFSLNFLMSAHTRAKRDEIIRFVQDRWHGTPSFGEVYPRELLSDERTPEEFYFRIRANTCLYGYFEVGIDGRVRPCPGLDQVCGDASGGYLRPALSGETIYSFWDMDKRKVEPCSRCALRLACADCTSAELDAARDPRAKEAFCPYDPQGNRRAYQWSWGIPAFVQPLTLEEGLGR